jgi:hypothetical protein
MSKSIKFHLENHKDRWCILVDGYGELTYKNTPHEFIETICILFNIKIEKNQWWLSDGEIWVMKKGKFF